jgi:hypothetical protein
VPDGPFFSVKGAVPKIYMITKGFRKAFCSECGTAIYQGPVDAPFVATFPTLYEFAGRFPAMPAPLHPTLHYNFENCILPELFNKEGVTVYKDFPKEIGGSGEKM